METLWKIRYIKKRLVTLKVLRKYKTLCQAKRRDSGDLEEHFVSLWRCVYEYSMFELDRMQAHRLTSVTSLQQRQPRDEYDLTRCLPCLARHTWRHTAWESQEENAEAHCEATSGDVRTESLSCNRNKTEMRRSVGNLFRPIIKNLHVISFN